MGRMEVNLGLTDEQIEKLQNGETVEVNAGELQEPGYNTTIVIDPVGEEVDGPADCRNYQDIQKD